MSRFNKGSISQVGPKSAIVTTGERILTHEGGSGYKRSVFGELFLLAASFMGGDDNFYEKSDGRYKRLIELVTDAEVLGDPEWVYNFVGWLRKEANMRTVAMVVAVEYVQHRAIAGDTDPFRVYMGGKDVGPLRTNRDIVSASLQRADEPAEALAYYLHKYGKTITQPVKNGVSDAAKRLYNEFSYLKYGKSRSASVSMLDVLRLLHVKPKDDNQSALFSYITGAHKNVTSETLPMMSARSKLYDLPVNIRRIADPAIIKQAGMTWENLSEWLPGGMDAEAWQLAIPNMGIMALIRNLRNFDEAGISIESRRYVEDLIHNPGVVKKSRQLPFRWYQAYRSTDSLNYASALEEALNYSLSNIPKMNGTTLVLVDMSGSMFQGKISERSVVTWADAASLFGTALKLTNPHGVDLYQFGSPFRELSSGLYVNNKGVRFGGDGNTWTGVTKEIDLSTGGSVLRGMAKFHDMGGTQIHRAIVETMNDKYDRVILLTDEQGWQTNYDDLPIPAGKSLYVWNLAGYEAGISHSGKYQRHSFGGLSDSAFKLIPILESGKNASWPWIVEANGKAQ